MSKQVRQSVSAISFLLLIFFFLFFISSTKKDLIVTDTPSATSTEPIVIEPPLEVATATYLTATDTKQNISWMYPDKFYYNNTNTKYVLPVEWPPTLVVSTGVLRCSSGEVNKRINQHSYCVGTTTEGAAGSIYTNYIFRRKIGTQNYSLSFVTRTSQCGNYDEDKKLECEQELVDFKEEEMTDMIFSSIKLIKP